MHKLLWNQTGASGPVAQLTCSKCSRAAACHGEAFPVCCRVEEYPRAEVCNNVPSLL